MDIKKQIAKLPKTPGVYTFYDQKGEIIYVGKATSLKNRISSYFRSGNLGPKTRLLVQKIASVDYIKVFSEFEALLLEAELIKTHNPFFNIQAKDDKNPLYIKISNDKIPQVSTTRKQGITKDDFVKGPFPSAKATREILRTIRKIFPYCHHKNPKKPCLYVHLGLCPYPYSSENSQENYLKIINKIKKLISGKDKKLIQDLTREMTYYSQKLEFEEAQKIKSQIEKIQILLTNFHTPREFLERPTLVDDQIKTRLMDLKNNLMLKKMPRRIECYDISNFSGKLATGAMAVFTNGQSTKNEYRRFRIKFIERPDDYAMIREVLTRRLKNNWPKPNLIVVDGGRGQLNSALSVLNKFMLNIPVISIAKKLEEIYLPIQKKPIALPKESPARQLVQAIRDEAHRFAISYHQLLRKKNLLPIT